MTSKIQQYIRNLLKEDFTISLRSLSIKIYEEFSIQLGQNTIFLNDVRAIPEKRNNEHTILIRKTYPERFKLIEEQFLWRNIIFLYEVGFNISMQINKRRSLVGTALVSNIKNVRSKNISVCLSITKSGVLYFEISHRPYNKDTFKGLYRSWWILGVWRFGALRHDAEAIGTIVHTIPMPSGPGLLLDRRVVSAGIL
ncbi:hypothetical protein RF11_15124 [Thelohanellus kitauei]|uniref:Uncharacterized protein n=1 Tax=Thelohanellus kitauei TaxID=669202 RepID=A0A0C2IVT2_THEKT|nr:hypothetical protein RF11_15124 [Thelohanellus kitauei]